MGRVGSKKGWIVGKARSGGGSRVRCRVGEAILGDIMKG